jgi:predicted tellurium resistance membrane protein TerC
MKIKVNEGPADRIIRGVVGVLLLFLAMYLFNIWSIIPVVFAIALIFTSVFGYCGLYKLLGFNTLSEEQLEERDKKRRQEAKKRLRRIKRRRKERRSSRPS